MTPIYNIPDSASLVVVSDYFSEDLVGGAELTLQAILEKCPKEYFKIRSNQLTQDLVERGKDKTWLLVNFSGVQRDVLVSLATSGIKYYIIECDYKYCAYRSSHLHKLQTGQECHCETEEHGRFIRGIFKRSQGVFFMSQGQMNEYILRFPDMASWPEGKLQVQGSTFSDKSLEQIESLCSEYPVHNDYQNKDTWAILSGGSWIKNEKETVEYCKSTGKINYDLIGGLPHLQFLIKLSTYKGLIFRPAGFDTNPRITIEAKLLGLELDLNDNVQQKDEPWFAGPRDETYNHLFGLADKFWKERLKL